MKNYQEVKYSVGEVDGKKAWINPEKTRIVNIAEDHADDFNAQFENTGIKYELVHKATEDGISGADTAGNQEHIITEQDLRNNPELTEHVKAGDSVTLGPTVDPAQSQEPAGTSSESQPQ